MLNHLKKQWRECKYIQCDIHGMIAMFWFGLGFIFGALVVI